MFLKKMFYIPCFMLLTALSHNAGAWGEHGHELLTRVAIQKMRVVNDDKHDLLKPFLLREHLLAHLSNVPDIVWSADYMGSEAAELNLQTHFIKLEKTSASYAHWDELPLDFNDYQALCETNGLNTSAVGTAPWRVLQFYKLMVGELRGLDFKPDNLKRRHIDQALTYAGLMAHFVGNLSNPLNTTENFDGQLSGNRGLNAYFSSEVVSELSFSLPKKVLKKAVKKQRWFNAFTRKERSEIQQDPQKLVWAMTAQSHSKLERLIRLDNRYSIKHKGLPLTKGGLSQRKPAKNVAKRYEKFIIQQMAIGADVLARLWVMAWADAGSPDMSAYNSDYYPVQPPFITPSYIDWGD